MAREDNLARADRKIPKIPKKSQKGKGLPDGGEDPEMARKATEGAQYGSGGAMQQISAEEASREPRGREQPGAELQMLIRRIAQLSTEDPQYRRLMDIRFPPPRQSSLTEYGRCCPAHLARTCG